MTLVADWNASVNVPFQRMRQQLLDGVLQEGVVGASDLMVVQRGAGVNQSVDVGAGFAWVQIDTGTRNGMGHVTNDAVANVALTAANGTNPRIDQIILRWNDSSIPTGSGNVPTLEVLTGTATVGATLTNRTGAAALPSDCLRLADLLIPTSSTTISNTQIRDRRPWARGAFLRIVRTAGNYSTSGTSLAAIDGTNLSPRIECSGALLRLTLFGITSNNSAGTVNQFGMFIDGAAIDSTAEFSRTATATVNVAGPVALSYMAVPAAGSHTFAPAWSVSAGAGSLNATSGFPLIFTIEELVRQNTANNTTTSG